MTTALELQYHEACRQAYREASAVMPPPTRWAQMMSQRGAYRAALALTALGTRAQSGLYDLYRAQRLDLSVEASVLDPAWAELFDRHPDHQRVARARLDALDQFQRWLRPRR